MLRGLYFLPLATTDRVSKHQPLDRGGGGDGLIALQYKAQLINLEPVTAL